MSFSLAPWAATLIFTIACLAGVNFRRLWHAENNAWPLWVSGITTATCLLVLAFVPIEP